METLGERLKEAVQRYGPRPPNRPGAEGSVNQFAQLLAKLLPAGAGGSYQTVWRVIGGKEPSEAFVDAALQLLPGVRREWLVNGTGPRTEGEAVSADAAEHGRPTGFDAAVERAMSGQVPDWPRISASARARVWHVWAEYLPLHPEFRPAGTAGEQEVGVEVATRVGRAIMASAKVLEFPLRAPPGELARRIDSYIALTCEALLQLAPISRKEATDAE